MDDRDPLEELFDRAPVGSADLEEVLRLIGDELFHYAQALTGSPEHAEDALHEVLVALLEHGATGTRIRQPRAWLFTVLRRKALLYRTARKGEGLSISLAAAPADPALRLMAEEVRDALRGPAQEVLLLRLWEGLSFTEISEVLRIPYGTALSHYHRGLQALKRKCGVATGRTEGGANHHGSVAAKIPG